MIPILGALILQAAYGAVDLLVVGRFGSTSGLSAVSTGSQILNLVTFVVTQLAMGITVLIARYIGEKRPQLIGSLIGGATLIFTVISVILFVIMVGFAHGLSVLMQAPAEAVELTSVYVRICGAGMFFIVAYNVLAAIFFPVLGKAIGFDTMHGDAFGIFAGTAINDTSSVTAAASTWDSMWNLGSATLNKAVTVKLTRTLAIIPITLGLSFIRAKKERQASNFSLKRAFPMFILYFILAAIFTTVCVNVGVDSSVFAPVKELSKFLIIMAMAAIGLNSNVIQLIKTGGKPIAVGATCWCGITIVSLVMQHVMHIW